MCSWAALRCPKWRRCRWPMPCSTHLSLQLPGWRGEIAARIVKEVADRLRFLVDVGLDYLTLDRSAETLSGGEAQRIRLASQVGSGLTGVLYILDEPSIGLHQRDNQRLLTTLKRLRDLGNTVLVVEHDEEAIMAADHVLDLGPGRWRARRRRGGRRHAEADPRATRIRSPVITSSGRRRIEVPPRDCTSAIRSARSASSARRPTTCAAWHARVSDRPVHLRDRRVGLGQIHAGQRHALRGHRAPPGPHRRRCAEGRRASRASNTSIASSTSTRAPSAARHAPILPPTPACSRRCANCSRRCRRPARAATTPGASAST